MEHVLFQCQHYEKERERLLLDSRNNGVEETSLIVLFRQTSRDVFLCIFSFFRETRLMDRIYTFSVSGPHSSPVGGGNAHLKLAIYTLCGTFFVPSAHGVSANISLIHSNV